MKKRGENIASIAAVLILILGCCSLAAAQGAGSPGSKSFLWRVQSKTSTVYLLGSLHVFKREYYPLPPRIENAFEQSSQLAVEANVNEVSTKDLQKMMEIGLYPGNDTIEKHLSSETYDLMKGQIEKFGLPVLAFGKHKPWLVALTLLSLEIQKLGFDPSQGIDQHFLSKATGKKKIVELESFDYQMTLFSEFSEKEQELFLLYTLKDLELLEQELDQLVQAWRSGDANRMEAIMTKGLKEDSRLSPIYEILIYDRNKKMASKVEEFLGTKETSFVIVGAGHLVGARGVVELLKAKGYLVEQW